MLGGPAPSEYLTGGGGVARFSRAVRAGVTPSAAPGRRSRTFEAATGASRPSQLPWSPLQRRPRDLRSLPWPSAKILVAVADVERPVPRARRRRHPYDTRRSTRPLVLSDAPRISPPNHSLIRVGGWPSCGVSLREAPCARRTSAAQRRIAPARVQLRRRLAGRRVADPPPIAAVPAGCAAAPSRRPRRR